LEPSGITDFPEEHDVTTKPWRLSLGICWELEIRERQGTDDCIMNISVQPNLGVD
jgi:hypothetical protein